MQTLRLETTCTEDGVIVLRNLPVHEGDTVEIVVIPRSSSASAQDDYPLRGEPIEYADPFEPVAQSDWEVAQ